MEGRPSDEDQLIERARKGDVDAYAQLVGLYRSFAFRTAFLITREEGEAEDAAQEAFVKAYRALGRFRKEASFRPWLATIVANEARNRLRAARRRGALELRLASGRPSGDAAPSPEAAVIGEEDRTELMSALNALNERDRLVIAYRFFFDMGEAEMAGALNCARGTVKSRVSRALERLRAELARKRSEIATTLEAPDG